MLLLWMESCLKGVELCLWWLVYFPSYVSSHATNCEQTFSDYIFLHMILRLLTDIPMQ